MRSKPSPNSLLQSLIEETTTITDGKIRNEVRDLAAILNIGSYGI